MNADQVNQSIDDSEIKLDDTSTLNYSDVLKEINLLDADEVMKQIKDLKSELKDQVTILGHHYQQDDIISFADITGDSLILSQEASKIKKPYTIFCGVHFMAETADLLSQGRTQRVILPDLSAGCSMADMASAEDVEDAIAKINKINQKIIPITYVNSSAAIKALVGRYDGYVCTSSNAEKIIKEAFRVAGNDSKIFFLPDQHLGRNTCYKMGIPLEEMYLYSPDLEVNEIEIKRSRIILWNGYCFVHQGFSVQQIEAIRKTSPETKVIVHPECPFDVVMNSDLVGSTAYIVKVISEAAEGSKFAVGTEINLVNRLAQKFKGKKEIKSLSPYQCICSTMYRIKPKALLLALISIKNNNPINVIRVEEKIREDALKAINKMLSIK
ncbi:MAG: quinolinate synthase NadA [Oligoflexia bacterium]|nr:quinolinate synthase NadA [Oligoflexia bacterium]